MGCYLEKSRVILMAWPRFCTIIYGLRKENLNFIKVFMWPIALFSLRRLSALFLERITSIMPVHFDWRSLQQYALPALGIVSLLVSAIIAVAGGLGLGGSSSENDNADANVIFKVVDQHGLPRLCHVKPTGALHTDNIVRTSQLGTYGVKAEPGSRVTRIFDCKPSEPGTQVVEASAIAPQGDRKILQEVVIPDPNSPSASFSS